MQSDYNVTRVIAKVVSRKQQYADLDLSLTLHPDFHDIIPLTDIDAVIAPVKNLILTNFDERPFHPELGSNLRALLFEPADRFTEIMLRNSISDVLKKHEPRIDQVTILIQDNADENRYDITIGFRVTASQLETEARITLKRLR